MEKINIAELLKDCPSGMELDCAMYDNVQFDTVQYGNIYPIKINTPEGRISLSKYGCYSLNPQCKCIIFPKGKTTWEGFQRPFKDGDIVFYNDTIAIFKEWDNEISFRTYVTKYLCCDSLIDINTPLFGENVRKEIRFATEEEKEKLFYAIKAFGYKWVPKTKTLKELKGVMRMWISRGEGDNYCVLFKEKPYKYYDKLCKKHFFKTDNMYGTYMCLPAGYFPSVTFDNSPQQVEIKLI